MDGKPISYAAHLNLCMFFRASMLRVIFLCVALLGAEARVLLATDHLSQQKGDSNVRFPAHPSPVTILSLLVRTYGTSLLTHYGAATCSYPVSALCQQDWVLAMQKCQGASLWTLHGLWVSAFSMMMRRCRGERRVRGRKTARGGDVCSFQKRSFPDPLSLAHDPLTRTHDPSPTTAPSRVMRGQPVQRVGHFHHRTADEPVLALLPRTGRKKRRVLDP